MRRERAQGVHDAAPRDRREDEGRALRGSLQPRGLPLERGLIERIRLRKRHDFRFLREALPVGFELRAHGRVGLPGMFRGGVDEVEQHAAAFDMAEEAVAEAMTLMRALDQARNIGEHEFAPVAAHHAEPRMQGGEGVIGDLRLRRRHDREESRFPGVRQADEPGIRDELQPQENHHLLARLAGIGSSRRAVGRGLEIGVAEASVAALRDAHALADLGEIGKQGLAVLGENLGARRHLEHRVGAIGAMAVPAHAVAAGLGLEMLLIPVVDQGVEAIDADRRRRRRPCRRPRRQGRRTR